MFIHTESGLMGRSSVVSRIFIVLKFEYKPKYTRCELKIGLCITLRMTCIEHNKSWSFVRFLEKMSTQSQCWNCPIVWHKRWLLYQNCVKHTCHCSVVVKRSVWFWHIFACSQLGSQSQFYFYLYAFSHTFSCFIFCENVWLHFHHQLSLLLFHVNLFFFANKKLICCSFLSHRVCSVHTAQCVYIMICAWSVFKIVPACQNLYTHWDIGSSWWKWNEIK